MMLSLFKTVGVLIEVAFGSCKRGRLLVAEGRASRVDEDHWVFVKCRT